MIDKISFHTNIAGEKMCQKLFGELWLAMQKILHDLFFDTHNAAGLNGVRGRSAKLLTCQGGFTKKAGCRKMCNNSFLAAHGHNR